MTRHSITLATLLALSATTLSAQSLPEGTYIQGNIGFSQLQDSDFSGIIGGSPQNVATDFDDGYGLGIAIGREIPQWSSDAVGTRFELELSYRDNDADGVNFSGNGPGPEGNVSGGVSQTSLFANLLFDFKQNGRLTPYAGFGIGATYSDLDVVYGPGVAINGDDTTFAAQLIAGVAYDLNDATALTLDARYSRAFDVSSPRFAPNGVSTGTVEDDLDTFSVNFGVRFNF